MKTNCRFISLDAGLLILRVGIGIAFLIHGFPKISGGPEVWTRLGGAIGALGIPVFAPAFWGFMAALAEFGGGLCLVTGFLVRPAAFLMFCTMMVAMMMHLGKGHSFGKYSHALEDGIFFLGLMFTGAGKYTLWHFIQCYKGNAPCKTEPGS